MTLFMVYVGQKAVDRVSRENGSLELVAGEVNIPFNILRRYVLKKIPGQCYLHQNTYQDIYSKSGVIYCKQQ